MFLRISILRGFQDLDTGKFLGTSMPEDSRDFNTGRILGTSILGGFLGL